MKKIKQLTEIYSKRNICMFLLLCTGIVLIHVYRLDSIPGGINVDEMGMGYDAWCLANFGVDRYLNSYPLYFINFCAGQSVLYGYICAVFVKIFGLSLWTLRFPGVLFSLLTVAYGMKLVILRWGKRIEYVLLFMALFMSLPVFLFLSRIGLDCNLMLGMMTVFLYYFSMSIMQQKKSLFVISGILAGITLYSYILSYLMLPVFLFCMLCYVIYLKRITIKQVLCFVVPLVILGLPLFMTQLIQILDLQTMKIGIFTLPKMYQYRGREISFRMFFENLQGIWKAVFLFDTLPSDSVERFGNLYYISLPFVAIGAIYMGYGVWKSFYNREWDIRVPLFVWFLIEVLVGCCIHEKAILLYRYNAIYISIIFFLIEGISLIFVWLLKKKKRLAYAYGVCLGAIYGVLFLCFVKYYFMDYSREYSKIEFFNYTFEDAVNYLEEKETLTGKKTYIGNLDQTYIYFLGGELLSPYEYNQIEVEDSAHLWEWANSYEQYQFYLPEDIELNANYIVDEWSLEYREKLEEEGFLKEKVGHYYVYTSPLNQYDTYELDSGYGWDAGITEENNWDIGTEAEEIDGVLSQVIVGWTMNENGMKLWDDVFLTIGENTYYPQKTEREDIVEQYHADTIKDCGLLFIIPQEEIKGNKAILNCIDNQKKIRAELDITIENVRN